METTLITLRWPNIAAIWIMVIALGAVAVIGGQVFQRFQ